ncbi:Ubiquitin carboxyl-terminal hydrolase 8 [Pleurostoma richardsiae]|uniref:ubiquitinyl hydrolase 1 n=1 Tax=Pleurostoma richardsiae TaxID=41990 RepID=A0AA38RC24_9PEZI|nr:Ubiquitin carboxyl-terminal hydrolase 8 [Pleurostoma richardsiae]
MKAGIPKRFLTLRDKNGAGHRRSKSSEGHRTRPLSAEAFFSMFKNDASRQFSKEDDEKEKENAKIEDITKRLTDMNVTDIPTDFFRFALSSKYAAGDVDKAIEVLLLQQKSFAGIVLPYNPNVTMLGAENLGNVTCYLDALLFAMFAKLEAFECMLKNELSDEPQRKLAALLRLWVNMLRTGKLIHTDMTKHIQDALAACGWRDAQLLEQQDTSEAFAFITETLQLPLLTLQVDLFHQGKRDDDDHKVVYERLLNLAVPADPDGKGIKLEDCLEEYFNTKVDVLRDSLEEKMAGERSPLTPRGTTIHLIQNADDDNADPESTDHIEDIHALRRRWTTLESPASTSASDIRPQARHRSTSIIQRVILDEEGRATETDAGTLLQRAKRTGSTVVKAVTIPAWQFFRLIPWHAASNSEPQTDVEVAKHFNQRPVVGICLKRYMMTESGMPRRQNTFIDIPDSLRLPHFMMVDDVKVDEVNGLSAEYKLVLQSVVCHRGDSLHSGHYISFARVAPKLLTDNRRHDSDPPPDYEEAQWVKFDDLNLDNRVSYVDDIKQALREEMPYLLFYQIVPMVDITAASTNGSENEPPSYNDSTSNVGGATGTQTPTLDGALSRQASGYFDSSGWTNSSTGPSIRFSSELERPPRLSFTADDDPYSSSTLIGGSSSSRRGSLTFSESTAATPAITPETGHSPAVTPGEEPSTAQRISRRFAKTASGGSRSRPASQAGENRISITMSRLGGLMRTSKEPLREADGDDEADDEDGVPAAAELEIPNGKEHHHHHHHSHKKERGKSKSRGGGGGEKEKAKVKTGEPPERECVVM